MNDYWTEVINFTKLQLPINFQKSCVVQLGYEEFKPTCAESKFLFNLLTQRQNK